MGERLKLPLVVGYGVSLTGTVLPKFHPFTSHHYIGVGSGEAT